MRAFVLGAALLASAPALAQWQIQFCDSAGFIENCPCPDLGTVSVTCTQTSTTCPSNLNGSVISESCADGGVNPFACAYDNQYYYAPATYNPVNACTYAGGAAGAGSCAAVGTLTISTHALSGAASYCEVNPQPYPNTQDTNACWPAPDGTGGPTESGNGIGVGSMMTHSHATDLTMPASLGRVTLSRTFVAGPQDWGTYQTLNGTGDGFLPKPFGSTPTTSTSLNWALNYFSFIFPRSWTPYALNWYVRTTQGDLLEFQACAPLADAGMPWASSCSALPNAFAATTTSQLVWNGTSSNSFTLIEEGGTRYVYGAQWLAPDGGTPHYFLTQVQDRAYTNSGSARVIATVSYAAPSGLTCPGVAANGAPYISNIQTIDGAQLNFHYKLLPAYHGAVPQECVLSYVGVVDRGSSTEVPFVQYTYATDGGAESEGLIARVDWDAGRYDTYTYPTAGASAFTWSSVGTTLTSQSWSSALQVTSFTDLHDSATLSYAGSTCGTDYSATWCFDAGIATFAYSTRNAGNATNSAVSYSRAWLDESTNFATGVRTHNYADTCAASSCGPGAAGTNDTDFTRVGGLGIQCGQATNKGTQDENGNWTARTVAQPTSGPAQETEVQATLSGATDNAGTSALETTNFTYAYGATNQEQLVSTTTQTSTFGGGNSALTQYTYSSAGKDYLTSIIKKGWTEQFTSGTNAWAVGATYVGTFYFQNQPCTSGGADTLGRTLEVHGPCSVVGLTSTDCDNGGIVPITQFNYYSSSGSNGNAANRLHTVVKYTSNSGTSCTGASSLTTTYNSYDFLGNVTSISDPAGATTTYAYQEDLVTSRTVGGNTWKYAYDNRKLTSIQYPTSVSTPTSGLFEVFCYRTGSSPAGGCTGGAGTWTDRLQWKAKYSSTTASSTTWTEQVAYAYWGDGTLKSETYYRNNSGTAEERRYKQYAADARLHPTFEQWGDATGSYSTATGYDAVGNVTGVGIPYNPEADWCQTSGAPSPYCAQLKYSRANRLGEVDLYPAATTASDVRTCIDHDLQGNVIAVFPDCTSSNTCHVNQPGSTSNCGADTGHAGLLYLTDDFGNLVGADLPWTNNAKGAAGPTYYQRDAMGNVTVKQTQKMNLNTEYISYAYDSLGRQLSAADVVSGTSTFLYYFFYDSSNGPYTGCPSATYNNGRLAERYDNFNRTWYSYDALGHVIKEIRLRSGSSCTGSFNGEPHTTYAYNVDGVLTSIREPYERGGGTSTSTTPSWTYNLDATDRPTSISVAIYNGTTWSTSNLISAIAWEPYGGLRGYQVNTPDGGVGSVEYMLGDNATKYPGNGDNAPTACTFNVASTTNADHAGRLRTLAVSAEAFTPGTATADIYKVGYKWQADQIVEMDTCILDAGTPRTEQYLYDSMLRITDAGRPSGNFASTGGSFGEFSNQLYSWNTRTNMAGVTDDACTRTLTYNGTNMVDQLASSACGGSGKILAYSYVYDNDGRVTAKNWPNDQSGNPAWFHSNTYGDVWFNSTDTVARQATVGNSSASSVYSYRTDAFGRRRAKFWPTGWNDEYFHDLGHQLIADQGLQSVNGTNLPVENYIWLGGRPVVVIRGEFDVNWNRQSDWTANCTRMGDGAPCGVYFPVTDHLGKPVLILDSTRRVTGEASYNPFGHPNRVYIDAETPHPYMNPPNTTTGWSYNAAFHTFGPTWSQPQWSAAMSVQFRGRIAMLDNNYASRNSGCTSPDSNDDLYLYNPSSGSTLQGPWSSPHYGQIVTNWFSSPSNTVQAEIWMPHCQQHYMGTTCACNTSNTAYTGVIIDAYEYQRYQTGAAPYWLPIRFPGHYYDPETDLFENWNRYYDPSIGKYLTGEPMLAKRNGYYATVARRGRGLSAYGYCGGGPIRCSDRNGLDFNDGDEDNWPDYLNQDNPDDNSNSDAPTNDNTNMTPNDTGNSDNTTPPYLQNGPPPNSGGGIDLPAWAQWLADHFGGPPSVTDNLVPGNGNGAQPKGGPSHPGLGVTLWDPCPDCQDNGDGSGQVSPDAFTGFGYTDPTPGTMPEGDWSPTARGGSKVGRGNRHPFVTPWMKALWDPMPFYANSVELGLSHGGP